MTREKDSTTKLYTKKITDTAFCFTFKVNNKNTEACFFPHYNIEAYKLNINTIKTAENNCIYPKQLQSIMYDVKTSAINEAQILDTYFKGLDDVKICFNKKQIESLPSW